MTLNYANQVVVVTGGGRGLGRAIALGFAAAGATTIITGRDLARIGAAAADLGASGGIIRGFACDVSDHAATIRLRDQIASEIGPVDVLVNNAGINPWYRRPEATPLDEWHSVLDTNLTGVFIGCTVFGTAMLERERGSIINITSVAGHVGLPRTAAYCAAKGGVELLSKSIAVDWATRNVRVNCVAPGYFETDLTEGLRGNEKLSSRVLARTPMAKYGQPEDIVGACLFLGSAAASYVTGQSLRVDGGFTAA
jgi:NAD(P)-dependent dehydrogenase (short-subunit alcohol dehydrogenase family)